MQPPFGRIPSAADRADPYLRKARNLTQVKLAEQLGVAQSKVSRLEQLTAMYVSTLPETGGQGRRPGSLALTLGPHPTGLGRSVG